MPTLASNHWRSSRFAHVLFTVATLALVMAAAACAGQSAPPLSSTATIPQQVEQSPPPVDQTTPAPPALQPRDDATEDVADTTPPDPDPSDPSQSNTDPSDANPSPSNDQPSADDDEPVDPNTNPPGNVSMLSDRGVALGCIDATELRRWLATADDAVADAAATMPDLVWLCPQTADVTTQLDCFPNETAAILAGLSAELGTDVDDIVTQIQDSNTTFCASGDHIRLGLDAILESTEQD